MLDIHNPLWTFRIKTSTLQGLYDYAVKGKPVGGFLQSVIANQLVHSILKADEDNRQSIVDIAQFMYEEMPAECWGGREIYKNWIEIGGLQGKGLIGKEPSQ